MDLEQRNKYLEVFRRYPGSQAALERFLGITHAALWGWFRGKSNSKRIEDAVIDVAGKLEDEADESTHQEDS
jgi:hypothetical protein